MDSFAIQSTAFADGASIPVRYTGEGDNVSPSLFWRGIPAGTKSLALVCEDPDAPRKTWIHWVLYRIPPTCNTLAEGMSMAANLKDGIKQGRNSWGNLGYEGPFPPEGDQPHRYLFRLHAFSRELSCPAGLRWDEVMRESIGFRLGTAEVMGVFGREGEVP